MQSFQDTQMKNTIPNSSLTFFGGRKHQTLQTRVRALKVASLAVVAGTLALTGNVLAAADTVITLNNGSTNLNSAASYSIVTNISGAAVASVAPGVVPSATTDILFFNNGILPGGGTVDLYSIPYLSPTPFVPTIDPGSLTLTVNANMTTASINDANRALMGTSITITNTSATADTLTISGGANNNTHPTPVATGTSAIGTGAGNASDLIYVANGANLTFANTTGDGTLALALTGTGNIDNNGLLSIGTAVTITAGKVITFTGTGDVTGTAGITTETATGSIGQTGSSATVVIGTATSSESLVLDGANTYTGATTVTAATTPGAANVLVIESVGALGGTSGVTVTGTGAAVFLAATPTTAVPLFLNGNGTGVGTGPGSQGALDNVSGTNTYSGLITLNSNNVYIGSDSGTLILSGGISEGAHALTVVGAGNVTVSSDITGAGFGGPPYSVTKFGTGTLLLNGTNGFAGDIAADAGILQIGDGTTGSLTSANPSLAMGGGTFIFGGNGAGALTVNGLFVGINTFGASEVEVPNTGTVLNLGAITQFAGSTVDFTLPGGTQGVANGITTSTANDAGGIIGGYATVNGGAGWASNNGTGNIIALATYTNDTWAAGNNTTVTTSSAPAAASTTNSLRFNNAGGFTVTLSGANTITSGGILVTPTVGANNNIITGGSITTTGNQLSITQDDTLGTLTISSVISGPNVSLVESGAGQLNLFGFNTYSSTSGGTYLDGSTIEIGTGAANGGGLIQPFGLGTPGLGGVEVDAATTLTTDGNNTNGGAAAYLVTNVFFLNATLTVNVPGTGAGLTLSGVIQPGAGTNILAATSGLVVNNGTTGTLTLTGANTYTGGTIVDGGKLIVSGAGATLGASSGSLQVNGSAGGTLVQLNLTGGNPTTIGSLSGSTANGAATINNGNQLFTVDQTTAGTYAGTIAGTGGLTVGGTSALTLTGASTYSGPTTIDAGAVLAVGDGTLAAPVAPVAGVSGALGSTSAVTNNGTLETTASAGSPAQTIAVGGAYAQSTTGTLLLQVVGNEGVLPQTQASAGLGGSYDTLAATGLASFAAAPSDRILLNFQNGAPALPGQQFQVVSSVAGPVTSNPTTPTGVTTTGNINPLLIPITSYNDSFNGAFANNNIVVTFFQPLTTFTGLTPNQNSVATNLDGIAYALFNPASPLSVVTANGVIYTPLTGANKDFFDNILEGVSLAATQGDAGHALDELSPQRFEVLRNVAFDNYALDIQGLDQEFARERMGFGGVDTTGFTFNNSELGPELSQVRSRLLAWSPAPEPGLLSDSSQSVLGGTEMIDTNTGTYDKKEMAPETPENLWSVFVDGGADLGDKDGNNDLSHASYTTGRARLGADYRVSTDLRVGALFGYGHTDADLDNEGSKAHVDSYTPGVFLTYADKDGFYANGLFTYTANDYSTDRDIIIPGINRTANGSFSGNQFGGDLDGGYDFHRGNWTFGPSAGLTYVNLGMDSFTESGANSADLSVNSQSANSLRSRLGGTISYRTEIGSVVVTPHLSAYWQHEFLDNSTNITSAFVGLPGGTFAVQTTAGDSDSALLGVGLDAELNQTVTLFIDYGAEAGGASFFGQSATGGVKLGF